MEAAGLGLTALVAVTLIRNLARGTVWRDALPEGPHTQLLGCAIFAVGAVLGSQYEDVLGVARGPEALYTPTHLLELLGGGLIVATPFTNALGKPGGPAGWHVLLSAALTLSVATSFTLYLNPMIDPVPAGTAQHPWEWTSLGLAEIVVQVVLLSTIAALLMRSFTVPAGGLSLVCVFNGLCVTSVRPHLELLPVLVLTGLVADGAHVLARHAIRDVSMLSAATGGLIGSAYVLAYWASMQFLDGGTWWHPRFWIGLALTATLTGSVAARVIGAAPPPSRAGALDAPATTAAAPAAPFIAAATLKRALEALQDPDARAALPLARALGVGGPAAAVAAELCQRLIRGIDQLSRSDDFRVGQAGRLLRYYYVQRVGSQGAVAERLHVSRPTFYRRLQDGLELLAQHLVTPSDEGETH
jgi:hypothetical protein